jgi:hypothetical protein
MRTLVKFFPQPFGVVFRVLWRRVDTDDTSFSAGLRAKEFTPNVTAAGNQTPALSERPINDGLNVFVGMTHRLSACLT